MRTALSRLRGLLIALAIAAYIAVLAGCTAEQLQKAEKAGQQTQAAGQTAQAVVNGPAGAVIPAPAKPVIDTTIGVIIGIGWLIERLAAWRLKLKTPAPPKV